MIVHEKLVCIYMHNYSYMRVFYISYLCVQCIVYSIQCIVYHQYISVSIGICNLLLQVYSMCKCVYINISYVQEYLQSMYKNKNSNMHIVMIYIVYTCIIHVYQFYILGYVTYRMYSMMFIFGFRNNYDLFVYYFYLIFIF